MGLSRHLIRSASAVACLLLAACGTIAEAQSGLLLGLHRDSDENGSEIQHRTLWIAPQAGKLQIMELPDLLVPRKTGFWRVGTRFYCNPDEVKNDPHRQPSLNGALFAAPVNQRPVVYGVIRCPAHVQYLDTQGVCGDDVPYGARGIAVSFVNEEYISLNNWWRTDCGGHPDGGGIWSVEKLGDPARVPIAYGAVEGFLASNDYEWRAADALIENVSRPNDDGQKVPLGEGNTEDDKEIRENFPKWSNMTKLDKVIVMQTLNDGCFPKHDDREWYIARNQGQWSAHGNFHTHRLCGVEVDFELPLHAGIAAPAAGPISLDVIKTRITIKDGFDLKTIKGATDVFWSPDNSYLVVLVNMEKSCIYDRFNGCPPGGPRWDLTDQMLLQVYTPSGEDLGKPVISMPLKEFESTVMAEWATGNKVARWTTKLKMIKAQGVVKPLLSPLSHP
jgi:hypothetical protein